MPEKLPIAVLISGSGTNLQALIDAALEPDFGCSISIVISDRPGVQGLRRSEGAGITTAVVGWGDYPNRSAFTSALCDAAESSGAKALVLAGFMRILAPEAINRFPNAIINVHPALLPAFPGADAVEQALEAGVDTTGVTVHFVDELVDHGPVIAQRSVPIEVDDDVDTLHERIQAVEHRLLPEVVSAFGKGQITVHEGAVEWAADTPVGGGR
jgi:formyltetrahydrofolate-dependent phosphoribosylglycinamide formyltransferase